MNKTLHKWLPRIFYKKFDGGNKSGVTGYFLIEWKVLFSIGILHFKKGSREDYHSHAFNALTWFLRGSVTEEKLNGPKKDFKASLKPKYTPRENVHRVVSHTDTYALTFRGPWRDQWIEYRPANKTVVVLTHGREEIRITKDNHER